MTVNGGDIVRASVRFKEENAGDVMNTYHWEYDATTGPATDSDVMDVLDTHIEALYTDIRTILSNTMDPFDINYSVVDNVGGVFQAVKVLGTRSFTMATPPNSTGDRLPPMDAALVNLRTAIPRTFGRKFLGVLAEADQIHGILSAAALTLLSTYGARLIGGTVIVGSGALHAGVPTIKAGVGANWFARFTEYIVNDVIATQRRRRKGTGA